ncbi:MAG: hypothetical protein IPL93_12170 [Actinomycetales bacterium]|nr:hypothetical protein [Actinomycetales bacterium]
MSTLQSLRLRHGQRPGQLLDGRLPGLRAGLVAATVTWCAVLLLVALAWGTSAAGTADFGAAVGFASAAWLLGHGVGLGVGGGSVGLTPLGIWLAAVWVTLRTLERGRDRDEVGWVRFTLDFFGGYAVAVVAATLLTLLGPVRPSVVGLPLALSVPVAALALEVARGLLRADDRLPERLTGIPAWAVRGVVPAARGVLALGGLSLVVVLAALVVRWDAVTSLYAVVSPGLVGGLLLTLGQLCYLPTLGVWALSVLAGPGFQVTAGGHIGLDGSHPGLLPMLPALGLVPGDGVYPSWTRAALALPVLVGVYVGRSADHQWSRLGRWRGKALSASVAVGLLGLGIWVLAALGTGAAGSGRLAAVGPAPGPMALSLTGLLAAGALLWLGWIALADRFRR